MPRPLARALRIAADGDRASVRLDPEFRRGYAHLRPWHGRDRPPSSDELLDANGDWYRHIIDAFRAAALHVREQLPVDKLSCSYTVLWNQFKKLTRGFSADERAAMFTTPRCGSTGSRGSDRARPSAGRRNGVRRANRVSETRPAVAELVEHPAEPELPREI